MAADVVEGADMADIDTSARFENDGRRELETGGTSHLPHDGTVTNGMIEVRDVVV